MTGRHVAPMEPVSGQLQITFLRLYGGVLPSNMGKSREPSSTRLLRTLPQLRYVRKTSLPDVSDIQPEPAFLGLGGGHTLNDQFTEQDLLHNIEYMAVRREYDGLLAHVLAAVLPPFAYRQWGENSPYKKFFALFQRRGVSIVPLLDDSPIPNLAELDFDGMYQGLSRHGLNLDGPAQLAALRVDLVEQVPAITKFLSSTVADIGPVDVEVLATMFLVNRPKRIVQLSLSPLAIACSELVEINAKGGSPCEHVVFEPDERPELVEKLPPSTTIVKTRLSDSSIDLADTLEPGDMLILDQCKTVTVGNELFYLYNEVLPRLKQGVFVHLHPVFLPYHYPEAWLVSEFVFWNQQYVLAALLRYSMRFEVLYANYFLHREFPTELMDLFSGYSPEEHEPGSFWFKVKEGGAECT